MKNNAVFILSLLLITTINYNCIAQWSSNSLINTVISDIPVYEEATPLQANTIDGKTFISYFENSTSGYLMKLQLLDSLGNKLFGNSGLLISNHPQNTALYRYDLKIDLQGNVILAFQDQRSGNLGIYAYKIDTTGNELWGVNGITLHLDTATTELAPKIGILSNNDVVISWNASGSGNWKSVPYQKISSTGILTWSTPKIISGALKYSRPTVLGISNEQFIIVFILETGTGLGVSTIKAQQFDINGVPIWPTNITVSSYTTGFAAIPKVISDNNDGCYVGFDTGTPGNPFQNDVFVQHIRSNGSLAWTTNGKEVSALSTNNKNIRKLTFRSADNHIYVLLKVLDSGQSLSGVYGQSLDTAGVAQFTTNGSLLIPLSSTLYAEPYDWSDAGDGFITLYSQGTFGNNQMRGLKMDYTGLLTWAGISISSAISNKTNASCSDFKNGQVVCVWEDDRNDRGIYAQNSSTTGTIGVLTGLPNISDNASINISTMVNDKIIIKKNNSETFDFQLYSLEGKLVLEQKIIASNMELDIAKFKSGTYLYRLKSTQQLLTGKIIKIAE